MTRAPIAGDFCTRDEAGYCLLALHGGQCEIRGGTCPMSKEEYHQAWCRLVDRAAATARAAGGWLGTATPQKERG